MIRTFAYHFTVRYIPGVTNQFADCLSRLSCQKDIIKLPKLHIHQITSQLNARSDSLQDFWIATVEDDELGLLQHTITSGWPSMIREVPSKIQSYLTFSKELTVEDGIVLKGTHIVISHKRHQATLNLIHEGHLGLNKWKLRAKDTVYWPAWKASAELWTVFDVFSFQTQAETKYISWTGYTRNPWTKLATDIFHFESSSHLLILNYTKQISSCLQVFFSDRSKHCKPMQANISWIWIAWDLDFW